MIDDEPIAVVIPFLPPVQMAINDGGTVDARLAGIPCLGIVGPIGDVTSLLSMMQEAVNKARWERVETVVEVVEVTRNTEE